MITATAHCMHCETTTPVKDARTVVYKNGMKAIRGTCFNCGTKVSKITGKA